MHRIYLFSNIKSQTMHLLNQQNLNLSKTFAQKQKQQKSSSYTSEFKCTHLWNRKGHSEPSATPHPQPPHTPHLLQARLKASA